MSRSSFPQQIDSFVELYDLPASLAVKARRYQELKIQPSLNASEQDELNQLTEELGDYIIDPETWNKLGDAIVNVQTFFKERVDGYIDVKQEEWASYVKEFRLIGVYSNSRAYKMMNMVKYNGDLYLCIKNASAGVVPTNTTHWEKVSTKGDKGDIGLNVNFKGIYNSSTTYQIGDGVSYNGQIYYCAKANTVNVAPPTVANWVLWDKFIVSAEQPTGAQLGAIWVQIEE